MDYSKNERIYDHPAIFRINRIPCRRSFDFQGAVLDLAIKNRYIANPNLTIPSGMALVRVCYVAIRKSKTCSGSFGSRAGTLSKYVILNC